MNVDNSIRETCASYIDLLALATGRLHLAEFLRDSTFPLCLHMLFLSELYEIEKKKSIHNCQISQ